MASIFRIHPLLIGLFIALLSVAAVCGGITGLRYCAIRIPQRTFSSELWKSEKGLDSTGKPLMRQEMIKDLVNRVLPGKNREEIEALLGPSATHEGMRRYRLEDWESGKAVRDERGQLVYKRTGKGYYYDEYDWDLIYGIGKERIFIYDHCGLAMSPDLEYLIIRLGPDGRFASWYICGSTRWPSIVGEPGRSSFSAARDNG